MSDIDRLMKALTDAGVRNISFLRIGKRANRNTWEVIWNGSERPSDIATAATVIATVDLDDPALENIDLDVRVDDENIRAVIWAIHDELVVLGSTLTRAQLQANVRARHRQLKRT